MSSFKPEALSREQAINFCINGMDFKKVFEVMEHLDWGWARCGMRVPGVYDMIEACRSMLKSAWDKQCTIESGGFRAVYVPEETYQGTVYPAGLQLLFIVTSSESHSY